MATAPTKQRKPVRTPATEQKPLLELSTAEPIRPFATIDDVRHDFKLMQELGARPHQRLMRDVRRYDELWRAEVPLSEAEGNEMEELLDGLLDQVLADPGKFREHAAGVLTGAQKRELLLTFTNAPLLTEMARQMDPDSPSTTAS